MRAVRKPVEGFQPYYFVRAFPDERLVAKCPKLSDGEIELGIVAPAARELQFPPYRTNYRLVYQFGRYERHGSRLRALAVGLPAHRLCLILAGAREHAGQAVFADCCVGLVSRLPD